MNLRFLSRKGRSTDKAGLPDPARPAARLPLHLTQNAKVLPTRDNLLPLLPARLNFCEVGVALGDYTESVIANCDLAQYWAIDTFALHENPDYWGGRAGDVLRGRDHRAFYEERFRPQIESGVMRTVQATSADAIPQLADASLDVAYIDALHDYEGVRSDLSLIRDKMKPDGLIIANDYIFYDHLSHTHFGVVQALNEFMIEHQWEMIYFVLHQSMYCDVAIRRVN